MKPIKNIFIIALLLINVNSTFAQTDKLTLAFSKSYEYESKKNYTLAVSSIKEIYDPKSYEANIRLGWLYYLLAQYKESMSYYQIAINIMPYSIEAKFGYVYPAAALGNMEQVINQYNKILQIDPQNSTANYRMGLIYYDKKDYTSAYKYFEKVVNLYPFGYDALIMYAWTNYQTGKTREAKILFNKVLMLSPYDKSALEGLSLIK